MEIEKNALIDQGDHQSQHDAGQVASSEQQVNHDVEEKNTQNNAADQFFVEVVTNSAQRTTTPAKNSTDVAAVAAAEEITSEVAVAQNEIEHEVVAASQQQQSTTSQPSDVNAEQTPENQLVDLGEQLSIILKKFGEDVKSTQSLDNIKLLIAEENILTDHRSVLYELNTDNQGFFQKNVGKIATIGHAEIKAELAPATHNIILTLYAKDITVEGVEDSTILASFKIFDQLQYRDQKVLYDLAFAAKKALIREEESVSYSDKGIWKMLTEDYKKAAQTIIPLPAAAIPLKQQITSVQKQQLEAIPATTKKIQRVPQKKLRNQAEAQNKGDIVQANSGNATGLNAEITPKKHAINQNQQNKNQMEEEIRKENEEEEGDSKLGQQPQGSVSVLRPTKTPSVNRAVTEEQRKSLNALYQSNKTVAKADQMEEEEDQGEEDDEEQEDITNEEDHNAEGKSVKRNETTASIKKNSVKRINEIRKKAEQPMEKDQKQIEDEEYTRKLQKLQKFVLKKELLYFISSNDFQKKSEVRNMVLPRDPVNKDLMKSYSFTTIKHLEAQYK